MALPERPPDSSAVSVLPGLVPRTFGSCVAPDSARPLSITVATNDTDRPLE